ncbi:long-chain-fatty-acid--CoA ligase [Nocardioides mesophilus]|uniref:Long-chain-fatty-acid--CoA ligase n=2 Tax=Nocardioides mesophilus TaxID=433659 RepID=A0A7G9RGT4_9ACTN|nr:long-chain-fatty-acid--CoA ligase [Nocardioides mesophilus]
MVEMFAELAERRADHPALVGAARTVTYAGLVERANRVANALRDAGLGEDERVAYLDLNNPEFFELMLGAAKIGSAIAPLNFRLTPQEMGRIVADSEAKVLVVGAVFEAAVPLIEAEAPGLQRVVRVGEDYESWVAAAADTDPGRPSRPDDVVLQLYTSGTTGLPKGVMLTNDNCSALLDVAEHWDVDETSVSLVAMPLFHIGGSGWANVSLARGGTDVLVPMIDPAGLLDTIEQQRITNAFLVPAVLQMMCAVPGAEERDFSSLRSIAYGASPITSAVLARSLEVFKAPLFQVYGLTETTGAITELGSTDHDPGGPRQHLMRSAGKPYPWVEMKAVDPATGQECRAGQVGEIWIRSVQNSPGYWRKPGDTAAAFDAEGWLHTGDAGYFDDEGYLFLTDRIKDMIVTGAENVYPVEVESALSEHPDVADVAVIGVPDEKWGETVKAVVVRRPGSAITSEELLEWSRDRIAGFKRPRSVDFAEELPRNPSGKLLKRVLREPYWAASEQAAGRHIS